jgi:MFS transporter, SP family, arabinose:H+ symporter
VNKRLVTTAFAASLGGFVFGYDLGALSSASQSLRSAFGHSPSAFGLTIASSLWGTVCGSLLVGWFADRVGRRNLIAGCAAVYAVAAIAVIKPVSWEWIFVLAIRFICGLAIGGFTVGCPLYLSEMAPISHRGRFVSLFQVQVGSGVVVAFFLGSLFARGSAAVNAWRWCLGTGAIPATVLCLLISFTNTESESSTSFGRRTTTLSGIPISGQYSDREKLFRRKNTRSLLLATSIAIFNQLSGVNVLLLYMLEILASAGIGLSLGHTYTVVISCIGLATTLIAMAAVDNWGRKPLLLIGSAGMGLCLLSLAAAVPRHFAPGFYLSVLVAYNVFFAFSQGTVVWVYLSELFPPGVRGAGQGYGSSVHWITNAILISVFPAVQHSSSVRIFYFFALVMAIQIGVIWLWYPETRGTRLGSVLSQTHDE